MLIYSAFQRGISRSLCYKYGFFVICLVFSGFLLFEGGGQIINADAGMGSTPPAAFTPGNLVVFRVGNGAVTHNNNANPVFLDEFTTGGGLVQSIAMPTSVIGANKRLTASGLFANAEGQLSRSADGQYLIVPGYDAAVGTANITTAPANTVNRVLGRVNADAVVDTTTAMADPVNPGSACGGTSTNGSDLWLTTSSGGLKYLPFGLITTTTTQVSPSPANTKVVKVLNGRLYMSSGSTGFTCVNSVGSTGTPTNSGNSTSPFPGMTCNGRVLYSFSINPAGTIMYVAADESPTNSGIQKWTQTGGTWTNVYSFNTVLNNGTTTTTAMKGLTVDWSGANPVIYATTNLSGSTNLLISVIDDGPFAIATTLATAPQDTVFRGVDFAPQSVSTPTSTATPTTGTATNTPTPPAAGTCTTLQSGTWTDVKIWSNCKGTFPAASNTAIIDTGHTVTMTANAATTDTTVNPGGTLDAGANTLAVSGTFTLAANATFNQGGTIGATPGATRAFDNASTYIFNGSQTSITAGAFTFGNLMWNSSGNATPDQSLTINGNLTVLSSQLQASTTGTSRSHTVLGNVIVDGATAILVGSDNNAAGLTGTWNIGGNVTVQNGGTLRGTLNAGDGVFNIAGNLTNIGTVEHGAGAGNFTINFNGTNLQTVAGSNLGGLQHVGVNNSSGMILWANVSLSGTLTLTSGNILTGNSSLRLASDATVDRISGHVIGNLTRTYSGFGLKVFDVGTTNGYSPVTVDPIAEPFPRNITVKAVQGPHPSLVNPQLALSRYWIVTGTRAAVTFSYLDPTDIPGTATESNFGILNFQGGSWFPRSGPVDTTNNIASLPGQVGLDDFTLGPRNAWMNTPTATNTATPRNTGTNTATSTPTFTPTPGCGALRAVMMADQVVPPNSSQGFGSVDATLNAAQTQLTVPLNWAILTGPSTAAHIHGAATYGVNAPIIFSFSAFPAGPAGFVSQTFAITPSQVADFLNGLYYVDIHTAANPGGEIRGQLVPTCVSPTPTNTGTPTNTATDTATPTPTVPMISGIVTYGNALVGTPPSPRPVPDVLMSGGGSPLVSTMTNFAGTYSLSGFGAGAYTVTPSKAGGQNGSIAVWMPRSSRSTLPGRRCRIWPATS